jgi:hypothetical protein
MPSLPSLCHSVYARAPGRDGSSEQVVVLPEFCCPARRSRDVPNRGVRYARVRVPFGFSSRYHASGSRRHGIVHAFADATCRPRLPLESLFCFIVKPKMPGHAPSSSWFSECDRSSSTPPLCRAFVATSAKRSWHSRQSREISIVATSPVIWLTRKPATDVAFSRRQPLR